VPAAPLTAQRLLLFPLDSENSSLDIHRKKNEKHFSESPPTTHQSAVIFDLLDSPN
jgi:hypothetical protein